MTRKLSVLSVLVIGLVGFVGIATASADYQPTTNDEDAGILFMYEEEKMARDLYTVLGDQWGLHIFDNIAQSEQRHMDSVAYLANLYDITLPNNEVGVFDDEALQALYDDLLAQGMLSAQSALQVGVIVEETDIVDLEERIAQLDDAIIIQVYENLLSGSENHLQAFTRNLSGTNGGGNSSRRGNRQQRNW